MNNNRYEGLWFRDYQHGRGTMYYYNGDKYVGNWKEDKRNGKGTYTYANGAYYKGDWVNDKKEGKGVFDWNDGSRYEGEWSNNQRNGNGIFIILTATAITENGQTISKTGRAFINSKTEIPMKVITSRANAREKASSLLPMVINMSAIS